MGQDGDNEYHTSLDKDGRSLIREKQHATHSDTARATAEAVSEMLRSDATTVMPIPRRPLLAQSVAQGKATSEDAFLRGLLLGATAGICAIALQRRFLKNSSTRAV